MLGTYNDINNNTNNTRTDFQTIQQVRKDLVGEIDAIMQYGQHIHDSTNPTAKRIWRSIQAEEIVHVGELLALLNYLDPTQTVYVKQGYEEFNDITAED
ncbi:MAG: hypothetical protein IJU58_01820 [Clostridia bacterium]|nr:hypothetical protein [Clostridia bacterium]